MSEIEPKEGDLVEFKKKETGSLQIGILAEFVDESRKQAIIFPRLCTIPTKNLRTTTNTKLLCQADQYLRLAEAAKEIRVQWRERKIQHSEE